MARSLNRAQLIGNLGHSPEVKYTADGTPVANFTVATSESWKDKAGDKQERCEWHKVVVWRKLAEIAGEYLKKGSKVYVSGKLQTRPWEKDGVKHYTTEIVADEIIMLDSREKSADPGPAEQGPPPQTTSSSTRRQEDMSPYPQSEDDDLPFSPGPGEIG